MQFTVVYEQKTVNRRRCMICDLLIADGDLAFFKGVAQGKAVHESCRSDFGGDWYARDCASNFVQDREGWVLVTDLELQQKHEARSKIELAIENMNQYMRFIPRSKWSEELDDMDAFIKKQKQFIADQQAIIDSITKNVADVLTDPAIAKKAARDTRNRNKN